MFSKNETELHIELEKLKAENALKLAMFDKCSEDTLRHVRTTNGMSAIVHPPLITEVIQKGSDFSGQTPQTEKLL